MDKKKLLGKCTIRLKRFIIGFLFGGLAVFSTHFGIHYQDLTLNVRDMAPLCAGLLFDPWAGIIAGLIGGVERFIVGTWFGIGSYTRIACSVSTILAGFVAAAFSIHVFEGKKPSPFYAFCIGAMMEVFHMLTILLSHMGDLSKAFFVVRVCAAPMISCTAVGVMVATLAIGILSGQFLMPSRYGEQTEKPITRTFQVWLLIFVSIAFFFSFSFTYVAETRLTISNMQDMMRLNFVDLRQELEKNEKSLSEAKIILNHQALATAYAIANDINAASYDPKLPGNDLRGLARQYDVFEINVVDKNGIITQSTNPNYIGFDMKKGKQSNEFMILLSGVSAYLQDFQPISYDKNIKVMYAGASTKNGFIQVGYSGKEIAEFESLAEITHIASDRRIGKNGYAMIAGKDGIVVSSGGNNIGKDISSLGVDGTHQSGEYFFARIDGVKSYCLYELTDSYAIVLTIPEEELYEERDIFAYETAFMELILFSMIFILIFQLVKKSIVKNLDKVNESLARITGGDLSVVVDVHSNAEFVSLSNDINSTVATLKRYIAEAAARIDKELEFARAIQLSSLPSVFPPFPARNEFSLFAQMDTAKEVGGDFYDFFFINHRKLVLIIADVAGKGIPAALFMMKSKTLIKSLAETGSMQPEEILSKANGELCEGNDANMFVTVWMGIFDTESGILSCSNAAHEFPIVRKQDGPFALVRDKHGLAVGAMEGVRYKGYEIHLDPGDCLFVYTDGVTEATNAHNELYGEDRLIAALNSSPNTTPEELLPQVKKDIDAFVGKAPQFDDITMLALRREGNNG